MYTGHCGGRTDSDGVVSGAMTEPTHLDEIVPKMSVEDMLWYAFKRAYHEDHTNAAMHCSPVRYSPFTFRLAEQLWAHNYKPAEVRGVILDIGDYAEDTGR